MGISGIGVRTRKVLSVLRRGAEFPKVYYGGYRGVKKYSLTDVGRVAWLATRIKIKAPWFKSSLGEGLISKQRLFGVKAEIKYLCALHLDQHSQVLRGLGDGPLVITRFDWQALDPRDEVQSGTRYSITAVYIGDEKIPIKKLTAENIFI